MLTELRVLHAYELSSVSWKQIYFCSVLAWDDEVVLYVIKTFSKVAEA